MDPAPVFIYVLPIVALLVVGLVGSTRRLGFWLTVLLSIFLTPIGGYIAAVLSGPRERKPRRRRWFERATSSDDGLPHAERA